MAKMATKSKEISATMFMPCGGAACLVRERVRAQQKVADRDLYMVREGNLFRGGCSHRAAIF
jgi:hypothetical protein